MDTIVVTSEETPNKDGIKYSITIPLAFLIELEFTDSEKEDIRLANKTFDLVKTMNVIVMLLGKIQEKMGIENPIPVGFYENLDNIFYDSIVFSATDSASNILKIISQNIGWESMYAYIGRRIAVERKLKELKALEYLLFDEKENTQDGPAIG